MIPKWLHPAHGQRAEMCSCACPKRWQPIPFVPEKPSIFAENGHFFVKIAPSVAGRAAPE
jgi:hypothetical protein